MVLKGREMKSKQKNLWELIGKVLGTHGELIGNIHIIEDEDRDDAMRRVYVKESDIKGYCFEVYKCDPDPDDSEIYIEDGFVYIFLERWDDFDEAGIDKAIEILMAYAKIEEV